VLHFIVELGKCKNGFGSLFAFIYGIGCLCVAEDAQ
jgi:hypothetical protein